MPDDAQDTKLRKVGHSLSAQPAGLRQGPQQLSARSHPARGLAAAASAHFLANFEADIQNQPPCANKRGPRVSVSNVSACPALMRDLLARQVSLDVAKGQILAVPGRSGGGKTVRAETIPGLSTLRTGAVLCNGRNLAGMSGIETAKLFGHVPETVRFIAGTLHENIAHPEPDPDPAKVSAAARQARLLATINALPDGFQTQTDTAGPGFSKNQRHQLARARGGVIILLARKPLVRVQ